MPKNCSGKKKRETNNRYQVAPRNTGSIKKNKFFKLRR